MTPEEKQLLEKIAVQTEENNHILRGIRSANRWGTFFKIAYWAFIIIVSYKAYVYVLPYVDKLVGEYNKVTGALNSVSEVSNTLPSLQGILDKIPH